MIKVEWEWNFTMSTIATKSKMIPLQEINVVLGMESAHVVACGPIRPIDLKNFNMNSKHHHMHYIICITSYALHHTVA